MILVPMQVLTTAPFALSIAALTTALTAFASYRSARFPRPGSYAYPHSDSPAQCRPQCGAAIPISMGLRGTRLPFC